jgi:hypothetical protein
MKTVRFGRTGVPVSQLCFGTMSFGDQADASEAKNLYAACRKASYAQKLVTVRLGGVLKLLDPVLELNPLNDFWQSICAAELPPFLLG